MADYKRQFDELKQFADAIAEVLSEDGVSVHESAVYMRAQTEMDEYKTSAAIGVMYTCIYCSDQDRTLMECERMYGTVYEGENQAQKDAASDIEALREFCRESGLKPLEGRIELF